MHRLDQIPFGKLDLKACGDWTGIIQVAAHNFTVGLKSDGTVVAASWSVELAKWNLF